MVQTVVAARDSGALRMVQTVVAARDSGAQECGMVQTVVIAARD